MTKDTAAATAPAPRALVRADEAPEVSRKLLDALAAGDTTAVGSALARYAPPSQAIVVRAAFLELAARQEGEYAIDALARAGRTAEALVDTLPDVDGRALIAELDPHVVGAMLTASAGEALSTTVERVDPKRIEELLAGDLDLWTVAGPDTESRESGINAERLVRLLWTIFQTNDARARRFLRALNPDLVAYPLALAFADAQQNRESEDDAGASLNTTRDARGAPDTPRDGFFGGLREDREPTPSELEIADTTLVDLLERIAAVSPRHYRAIVARARELDIADVRERLIDTARDTAAGADTEPTGTAGDDLFRPLDDPAPKPDGSPT